MFKNVPNIKKNVARMQVKHLLNINSLDIIWSSFFFLTLNKLLREPVLVQKMKKSAKNQKVQKVFILVVLRLVYYCFLQVTRGNSIGK